MIVAGLQWESDSENMQFIQKGVYLKLQIEDEIDPLRIMDSNKRVRVLAYLNLCLIDTQSRVSREFSIYMVVSNQENSHQEKNICLPKSKLFLCNENTLTHFL